MRTMFDCGNRRHPLLYFIARVFWALLILTAFLGSGGCGDVTVESLDAASVNDVSPGAERGRLIPPDASGDGAEDGNPGAETHPPIVDAGGGLPVCPPEIMAYDCPQPKCDCRDR